MKRAYESKRGRLGVVRGPLVRWMVTGMRNIRRRKVGGGCECCTKGVKEYMKETWEEGANAAKRKHIDIENWKLSCHGHPSTGVSGGDRVSELYIDIIP